MGKRPGRTISYYRRQTSLKKRQFEAFESADLGLVWKTTETHQKAEACRPVIISTSICASCSWKGVPVSRTLSQVQRKLVSSGRSSWNPWWYFAAGQRSGEMPKDRIFTHHFYLKQALASLQQACTGHALIRLLFRMGRIAVQGQGWPSPLSETHCGTDNDGGR